jgi:hypothetical protein
VTHELKNGKNTVYTKPAKHLNTPNVKIGIRISPSMANATLRYQEFRRKTEEGKRKEKNFYLIPLVSIPCPQSQFI